MKNLVFEGIELYRGRHYEGRVECNILNQELEFIILNDRTFSLKHYSKISILIFDKLGFDLSTKKGLKISKETKNRNRVINIWNKMITEFVDEETVFSKLKDESFDFLDFEKKVITEQKLTEEKMLVEQKLIKEKEDSRLIFKGTSKQIELFEDKLVIGPQKEGLNSFISSFDGVTEIDVFFEDIRSVTVFKVGSGSVVSALFSGGNMNKIQVSYLRILVRGSEGNTPSHQFHPASDPYTVIFNLNQVTDPDKFKSKIDKLISQFKSSNRNSQSQPISTADELEKFSNLLEKGIITEEEFQTKKKQLLGL